MSPRWRRRLVRAVPWALALPWALWAAGRLLGLERGFPLVPLVSYTPYVAGTAFVPLAVALAMRRWAAAALSAAALACLALAVLPRIVPDASADGHAGPKLRVLTANLYRSRADPRELVRLVREKDVDVLTVQELTPGGAARLRQAGIARLLPHDYLATRASVYGSGIYARYPLRRMGAPAMPFRMPRARLRLPDGLRVDLVCVHPFPPSGPDAVANWADALRSLPDGGGGPVGVMAGDFNATLDHRELRRVLDRGWFDAADATGRGLTPTWPADRLVPPPVTIDHVLADERAGVGGYDVLDLAGSDHRPVLAVIALGRVPRDR
ncbi:MAG TPA: endonuclease/exonuclease/phosphatase family protein [Solirubrobacterales bacterium]|nr:endonuclease/exonuclease/phosphatase family protein [Solirubrobacterales bacterium]